MNLKPLFIICLCASLPVMLSAQQGIFLDGWHTRTITAPAYTDTIMPLIPASASITIHGADTLSKVPEYVFGDNANPYTSSMSENKTLMGYMTDRQMGVLRGPGGSISDVYFWNRSHYDPATDVPDSLVGGGPNWQWFGKRPDPWEAGWTMDIDSFYSILKQTGSTGIITVNYGYARYGTSANPVAQAAHLAADWVRYDKGRTKFWEIGNEVSGSWEAGYKIDTSLNQDGQPMYINGQLYGTHCRVFVDSMKAAARETGATIYIGAVTCESSSTENTKWNVDLMKTAGDVLDFYIVHSYFTPWQQNSTAATILSSPPLVNTYISYVKSCAQQAGVSMLPVALTEYNVFAVGSKQAVSQIDGMFSAMVVGEGIKAGLGEASRWDLANGWSNGDDHGMYAYNDPDVPKFTPHAPFYYLYFMRRFMGDHLLNTTFKGTTDITAYSSSFSSGQVATMLVNKGSREQYVRVNIENAGVGNRCYWYTLVGGTDVPSDPTRPFSRKVLINGQGPTLPAGGPLNYASIKAFSAVTGNELVIDAPPYSVTYLLADTGSRQLQVNDTIRPVLQWSKPADIVYGTKLSSTQLNASTYMTGTYSYSPQAGTLLHAGDSIPLSVTFTPLDATYSPVTKTVLIKVKKATPVVSWSQPADMSYGDSLSADQLDASASVPGTFVYDPPSGVLLDTGTNILLSVTFLPADSSNYMNVTKTTTVNVYKTSAVVTPMQPGLVLYPVPTNGTLVITGLLRYRNSMATRLKILSASGIIVRDEQLSKGDDTQTFDVSGLSPGVYLVQIIGNHWIEHRRFVKY